MTAIGACTTGAPPGFSDGEQWVIPLVGPLEDGLLLVPTFVNDQGPFLFAIDPDAYISIIDEDVLHTTKVPAGEGPHLLDESDTQQTRQYAEVSSLKAGTLTVSGQRYVQLVRKGTFDADGRRIHGVLGRDVIADSLVFGFDRDLGVATLSTQKAFKKPVGAMSLSYTKLLSTVLNAEVVPLPRRLVHATIGGMQYPLHVDFGATYSQLRPRAWPRANLATSETQTGVVDEVGVIRPVKQMGVADEVTVRDATTKSVSFVPYADKRWPDQDIEGTLGLGFFRPYSVFANWDNDTLYLTPRKDGTSTKLVARIGRWQSKTLSGCADVGCVKVSLVD
ncbi:MAG TPA: hypothetical protein VFV99_18470, partial [Kofleriaceae bacterium]|nr:hypothetical protein [Kofleriaceae bacterium]